MSSIRPRTVAEAAPWIVGAIVLAALVYFDLQTTLAYNDDWIYSWEVRHSTLLHPRLWPFQSIGLAQVWWALLVTPGHDQRLLRLSIVPMVLLAAYASFRIARLLGASVFWSRVASVTLLTVPLFMAVAGTFMTDVFYVGALMMAALAGIRIVTTGRGWVALTAWTAIACIQRPVGIAIAPALLLVWGIWAREEPLTLNRLSRLVAHGLVVGLAVLVPNILGVGSVAKVSALLPDVTIGTAVGALARLPLMLGLMTIPFALALLVHKQEHETGPCGRGPALRLVIVPLAIWVLGLGLLLLSPFTAFPGNVWTRLGLEPLGLRGSKPPLLSGSLYLLITVLALVTAATALVTRRGSWIPRRLGKGGTYLVGVSLLQFAPLLLIGAGHPVFDRYYLPVIAPLIPLLASWAGAAELVSGGWAAFALASGAALWIAGQQDYVASQVARDQAATAAYAIAPPDQVHAGYEENAVHVQVPYYDRTGHLPPKAGDPFHDPSVAGPDHPKVILAYAARGDPRPGFDYESLASGRIVLIFPPD